MSSSNGRSGADRTLYHRLASRRLVYDWIQRLTGSSVVHRQVIPWLRLAPGAVVLDVGGGTGVLKRSVGRGVRHVCLDLERPKLEGYIAEYPDAEPIQADAVALPVRTSAVEAAALALVTHHLTDEDLNHVLREIARVLAADGVLVLYDAVWAPENIAGRLLWKYDRGSHPRTATELATALATHFTISARRDFAVLHRYVAFLCKPLAQAPSP